jgi:molybdate transport system substrate-binding protein
VIRWIIALLLLTTPASAADITVLTAGAFKPVAAALIPAFHARTGNTVTLRNDTVGALLHRIAGGESFDIVLMSPTGLDALANAGKIILDSVTPLAKVGIGVGVKAGAPKPDITTVAAFKAAMLNARSVAVIDPASGGSSGIAIAKLFQNLGIAGAMAPKLVLVKGGLAAEAVANDQAELVVHQISEIIAVPGVTLIGPLPSEIQSETLYAGAVASASAEPDPARAFLAALSDPAARAVLSEKGMMPP